MERDPKLYVSRRKAELLGHDSHNLVACLAQLDRPADDILGAAEPPLPELIADNDDTILSNTVFSRLKSAAHLRMGPAQHGEKIS